MQLGWTKKSSPAPGPIVFCFSQLHFKTTAAHTAGESESKEKKYALLGFNVSDLALIAGLLGFWAVAGTAAYIAKVLFAVFLVLFLISLIRGRKGPPLVG